MSDDDNGISSGNAYVRAVEAITMEMARAFEVVWSRPNGPAVAGAFLSGELVFQISRHGVTVLLERPVDGSSVPDTPEGL